MEKEGSGRSKRVKADRTGRFAALEKLKLLKGSKNKYEVLDEAPVYEELNEKDFSKLVQQRQEDDWIVDDDGSGYVEDGREIFDDEVDAATTYTSKKQSQSIKKKCLPPEKRNVSNKMGNIKNMFQAQPLKRKNESDLKLDEDDDLLDNILESVHNKSSPLMCSPKPMMLQKKSKRSIGPALQASPLTRLAVNPFAVKSSNSHCEKNNQPLKRHLKPKVINFNHIEHTSNGQTDKIPDATKDKKEETNTLAPDLDVDAEMLAAMDSFDDFSNMSDDLFASQNGTEAVAAEEKPEDMDCSDELFEDSDFVESVFNPAPETKSRPVDIVIDLKGLPLTVLDKGESVLRFFWFDAYEDSFKHPGIVYLFGKIFIQTSKSYVSCCVIIKDIPRRIYVLPRETKMNVVSKTDTGNPVTMKDVYLEINAITEKMKISEFKTKKTKKKYAFDNAEIPDECEYLEMQYSAAHPALPSDLSGSTFSHVLGTDTSSLEILLLEQKLKGPCWIDVHVPQLSNPPVTWCKIEAVVHNFQNIVPVDVSLPIPPLVVFSMNVLTSINSKTQQNEIAAISCVSHNDFLLDKAAPKPHYNSHFCALSKPGDCIFPYDFKTALLSNKNINIENLDSERALLAYFLAKLHKADPDVIIGHDVLGFGLDVLLHRVVCHKIPNWSRIGRLKRSGFPRISSFSHGSFEKNVTCGRLLCDVKISAKELLRLASYELTELSSHILQLKFQEISPENVRECYSSSTKLMQLVNNTMMAADIVLRINCELNILPLALQITNIAGCVMSRTLLGGRSERNEFLLLHAFHEKNYIYPAKVSGKKSNKQALADKDDSTSAPTNSKPGRKKPAYEGGLVLDPKIGFYDKYILLMDFNSLYPSIIQEYNICFTTIDRSPNMDKTAEDELLMKLKEIGSDPGVLPTEIRKLVDSRKQVKQMMKDTDISKERLVQYDIRQRALKLTANSMYGCLGFSHSRFYAKFLAALVTRKGREVLMQTKELVEKMGLDVIYGDTDSIMINTNKLAIDDVFQLGNKVKVEINKLYRLLEIDIDGVYKSMLLLKKKKYAALAVSRAPNGQLITKEEMKGLDIVRRDWSQLAKTAGEFVIKQILSSKPKEEVLEVIHAHLIALGEDVSSGKRPVSDFIIMKQLNKNPEDYPDMKSLPHVAVALRLNSKGGKKIRQHDTVPYIVCKDGSDLPYTQRAYHPDELKATETLSIDFEYYLANQVHPVISRLCAPIEGTDAAIIAKLLGLNPSKYVTSTREEERYEDKFLPSSSFDDEERFKLCDKLTFTCPAKDCHEKITVDFVFKPEVQPLQLALSTCPKCNLDLEDYSAALCNQLRKITRPYISMYYKKTLICEDVGCAYQTRKVPLIFSNGGPVCPLCKKANLLSQYTESQLYTQLAYFRHLFDIDKSLKKLEPGHGKVESDLYERLKATADNILKYNSYGEVNLSVLFHGLFTKPSATA